MVNKLSKSSWQKMFELQRSGMALTHTATPTLPLGHHQNSLQSLFSNLSTTSGSYPHLTVFLLYHRLNFLHSLSHLSPSLLLPLHLTISVSITTTISIICLPTLLPQPQGFHQFLYHLCHLPHLTHHLLHGSSMMVTTIPAANITTTSTSGS